VFEFFEYKDARAFAYHETVSIKIERTACAHRIIVASREGAHSGKASYAHRSYGRLRSSTYYRVGSAALYELETVSHGVRARRAGGAGGRVRPLRAEADRYLTRRKIDYGCGDEEWGYFAGTAFEEFYVFAFYHTEPAYAGAYVDSDTGGVFFVDAKARIIHSFLRGGDSVMDEDVHLLDFFLLDESERIEVRNLAGYAHGKTRGVEFRYRADARTSGQQIRPHFFPRASRSANQADACHYDTTIQVSLHVEKPALFDMLLYVIDGIAHALNFLGVFVGYLDVELFFEPHHKLNRVERIRSEVIYEARIGRDFAFVHA
jgi:hypothetical protein